MTHMALVPGLDFVLLMVLWQNAAYKSLEIIFPVTTNTDRELRVWGAWIGMVSSVLLAILVYGIAKKCLGPSIAVHVNFVLGCIPIVFFGFAIEATVDFAYPGLVEEIRCYGALAVIATVVRLAVWWIYKKHVELMRRYGASPLLPL
jgi:hypothetical protein